MGDGGRRGGGWSERGECWWWRGEWAKSHTDINLYKYTASNIVRKMKTTPSSAHTHTHSYSTKKNHTFTAQKTS